VTTPSSRDLRRDVLGIEGIADVVVEDREGTPVVRVWLDGSRDPDHVAAEIRSMLAASTPQGPARPAERPPMPRRTGLGRGLDSLIPAAGEATSPPVAPPLTPLRTTPDPIQLEIVAVVESALGVVVRAEDSAGRSAEVGARDGGVDQAVASAVAAIVGLPEPLLVSADVHEVASDSVVTVVLDLADGTRRVGSALARVGMPYTVGRAVWAALHFGDESPR
jgi:hypothetical protein